MFKILLAQIFCNIFKAVQCTFFGKLCFCKNSAICINDTVFCFEGCLFSYICQITM
jgi:hypothetical protein